MKSIKLPLFIIVIISSQISFAQNVGINSTGTAAAASSMLDITSANKGLLIPRIALTGSNDVATIPSAATSLLIYNTATVAGANAITPGYYSWSGTAWLRESSYRSGSTWDLLGNAGTVAGTNFIGTTDAIDFVTRTNNAERMRVTSGGFVGIGTTSPSEKLHVVSSSLSGFIRVESGLGYHSGIAYADGTNGIDFYTLRAAGTRDFQIYSSTIGPALTVTQSGNVGIGNTNPYGKFHVESSGYNSMYMVSPYNSFNGLIFYNSTYGTDIQTYRPANTRDYRIWTSGSGDALTVQQYGNVGIGTTNPYGKLHVETAGSNYMYMVSPYNSFNGLIFFNSTYGTDIQTYRPANTRDYRIWTSGTGDVLSVTQAGNVGIGTTAPGAKLEVAGQIKMTGGSPGVGKVLVSDATGLATWSAAGTATGSWGILGNAATVAGTNFIGTTDAIDFVAKTNNTERMRVTSAGNVGIGTTAPIGIVDISTSGPNAYMYYRGATYTNPSASFSYGLAFGWNRSNGNAESNIIFSNTYGSNTGLEIGEWNGTTYTADMKVQAGGNVGIGTTAPSAKLEVTGQIKMTGGSPGLGKVLVSDATGLATWSSPGTATGGWGILGNAATVAGTNFIGTTDAIDFVTKTNNTERMRITSAGDMGIGTTTPVGVLDILPPSGNTNQYIYFRGNSGLSNLSASFTYGLAFGWNKSNNNGESNIIFPNVSGNNRGLEIGEWNGTTYTADMKVQAGGNVGIGTVSPATKLHVYSANFNVATFQTSVVNSYPNIRLMDGANNGLMIYGIPTTAGGAQICSIGNAFAPIQASAFVVSSDRRMKHDIHSVTTSEFDTYMTQIRSIESATFKYDFETTRTENHIGVIAQTLPIEVQAKTADMPGPEGKERVGMSLADMAGLSLVGIKAIDYKQTEIEKVIAAQQAMIIELKKEIELLKGAK